MLIESAARSRARSREASAPVGGGTEFADALMLMQASMLKMIRLQLAVERHDRHTAIEMLDDLVALDHRLQECFEALPAAGNQPSLQAAFDADRFAVNQEKLALGAEVLLRPANPGAEARPLNDDDGAPEPSTAEVHQGRRWLAITAVLIACLAAAAYLVSVPDAQAWPASSAGVLR